MLKSLYNQFNKGIRWNAFEGFVYQTVLTLHQIFLFSKAGCLLYGLFGVSYSILYLFILIFNLGFDKSLPTLFSVFIKNKKNFKKIFLKQFLLQSMLILNISIILIIFNKYFINLFCTRLNCNELIPNHFIILSMLFFFESTKKSLRILCELNFLNKFVAIIEVFLILFYVFIFWIGYFLNLKINAYLVFVPHLIQSIIGVLIFSCLAISKVYMKIHDQPLKDLPTLTDIFATRFGNYVNQLSHILFSGNFLIPFLASVYGIEQISTFKLINVLAIYFTVILERAFGLTSAALLSHIKNSSNYLKQTALSISIQKLLRVLIGTIIFLLINSKAVLVYYLKVDNPNWISIYLFLLIIIIENLFIVYEQFFIVEAKIYYYTLINLIIALIFYCSAKLINLSLIYILSFLFLLRLFSFFILDLILKKQLKINIQHKINIKYIIFFIIVSLGVLFIFKFLHYFFR